MISVARLESFKLWRHPICWGLLLMSVSLLTLLFYRLCVDYLRLAQDALAQPGSNLSLSTDVLKPLCSWTIVVLALFLPIFTTYTFSQEFRSKTIDLWATSAYSTKAITFGKFLSLMVMVVLVCCYVLLLVSTLALEATLNWGNILTALLAILLIGSCFISFGLFISSWITSPLLAIGLTLLGNLFWMLLEWLNPFPSNHLALNQAFSLLNHSYHLLNGLLSSRDILYFLSFTLFWLLLTQRILQYKWVQN